MDGTVALVTGGAQGIGWEISSLLAHQGHHVVVADINADQAQTKAAEIHGTGVHLDVRDLQEVAQVIDHVEREIGPVGVLVNNAGVAHEDAAFDLSVATWNHIMSVDLTGVFFCSQAAARHMRARGSGAIVNLSSMSAFIATTPEFHVAYDVAKAGVVQMTRTLGVEWAPYGIRVNAVAPGRTKTPILDGVGSADPDRMQQWIAQVPQGRLFEAREIAEVVGFLASQGASAITAQTIIVDGGQTSA